MADFEQIVWRRLRPYLLILPAVLLFVLLFVGPMARSLLLSVQSPEQGYSLHWYTRFLGSSYIQDLLFTLAIGIATAIICLIVSLPIAFLLRRPFRGKTLISLFILFPLVVPHIIAGYALWLTLARSGPVFALLVDRLGLLPQAPMLVNDWKGLLIALVWKFFPITTLTVSSALESLDPAIEEAARDLGAGLWRRLREIVIPLLMPGLLSGFVLVFIMAAAQFSITLVIYTGTKITTIPLDIFFETFGLRHWEYGSALGIILTLITLLLLGIITGAVRRIYREAIVG
jgi:putative spermidine/putrescine transport system permease protein